MQLLARRRSSKLSRPLCCSGSRACRAGAERRRVGCPAANHNCKHFTLAIIAGSFCPVFVAFAQDITPTPETAGQPVVTTVEVILTGSNIPTTEQIIVTGSTVPTAEEAGPQPVDTYRRDDISRLGARSATDFIQKLPIATGASINENVNVLGNGQTEVDLRGLGPKETLVLQDGRRLAPNGFARYTVELNSFFGGTVDLNMFPIGLIEPGFLSIPGAIALARQYVPQLAFPMFHFG